MRMSVEDSDLKIGDEQIFKVCCRSTRLWLVDLQHFDNVMAKFIINKRTDAQKTDVNLFI